MAFLTSSRSEEHTSELQSQSNLVCRLLLEKKKKSAQIAGYLRCSVRAVLRIRLLLTGQPLEQRAPRSSGWIAALLAMLSAVHRQPSAQVPRTWRAPTPLTDTQTTSRRRTTSHPRTRLARHHTHLRRTRPPNREPEIASRQLHPPPPLFFFLKDPPPPKIYTLPLHAPLPI